MNYVSRAGGPDLAMGSFLLDKMRVDKEENRRIFRPYGYVVIAELGIGRQFGLTSTVR